MPIVAASNGIKPYIRSLAVIKLNKPVTPSEINDCVGTGDYASKYISKLRKDGFEFTIQRDGRNIVSYTLVSEPDCAVAYRAMKPKQKGAKKQVADPVAAKQNKLRPAVSKSKKPAKTAKAAKTAEQIKAENLEKLKAVSKKLAKRKTKKVIDVVESELGSSGEIATSYNIDPSWDSTDGLDIKKLVA